MPCATHLQLNILLLDGELEALSHLDLLLNEVNPGDHLRHRVLHLNAGVHLHEVEALLLPQKLYRANAHVVNGLGSFYGSFSHSLAGLQVDAAVL